MCSACSNNTIDCAYTIKGKLLQQLTVVAVECKDYIYMEDVLSDPNLTKRCQ